MSLLEIDTATNDSSLWDARIEKASREKSPKPTLREISYFGSQYVKSVTYTGVDPDRVLVQVSVIGIGDNDELVFGSEQPIEDPVVLFQSEITEKRIKVGNKTLIWRETPRLD